MFIVVSAGSFNSRLLHAYPTKEAAEKAADDYSYWSADQLEVIDRSEQRRRIWGDMLRILQRA